MKPPMQTPILSGRDVLVHQALLYGSEAELIESAVPYLREGTKCGDAVVAITTPANADLLRGRLGDDARPIEFIDSATWFQSPVQTLAAYYEHTRDHWWPRGRLRLFTEPIWAGRTPLEVQEWKRHEAILNVAFAGTRSVVCCAYDAAALPGDILADAARTHPELVAGEDARLSNDYTDPAVFYAECNSLPLPAPPSEGVTERSFASGALPALRDFVGAEARRHGLAEDRVLPLVLAVNEVATNIIRHGSGHGGLWMWAEAANWSVTWPTRSGPWRTTSSATSHRSPTSRRAPGCGRSAGSATSWRSAQGGSAPWSACTCASTEPRLNNAEGPSPGH